MTHHFVNGAATVYHRSGLTRRKRDVREIVPQWAIDKYGEPDSVSVFADRIEMHYSNKVTVILWLN